MVFVLDILLIVMASMWTIFILLNQVIELSTLRKIVPYEITTKVLNLITHIILLFPAQFCLCLHSQ